MKKKFKRYFPLFLILLLALTLTPLSVLTESGENGEEDSYLDDPDYDPAALYGYDDSGFYEDEETGEMFRSPGAAAGKQGRPR